MTLKKYKLGELVELVTDTNSNLKYGPNDVKGMTITKEVIPTKADVEGADLSKYIVVSPNEFIFNPRTHGKHIGFGFNNTNSSFIISWNNYAFRIKKDKCCVVLPDYLFLHFKRNEWDREACYQSWGTSTEVFTWAALCDMSVDLPTLDVQQKYVNIYNAMLKNQQAYERGLEDLKLVCDGYIEDLRRKMPCEKIGGYIEEYNVRNNVGMTIDAVRGIATSKDFIDTKANMDGVPLTNYKIVKPNMIAFISDTSRRGDKISLALNQSDDSYLVSSISTVVKTEESKLFSEYLFLFLTRNEFDRYARFNSWGSARETFTLEDMKEVEIPIPDIEIQKSIVNISKCYNVRKRINEQLKAQIKDICPILIKGSIEEGGKN